MLGKTEIYLRENIDDEVRIETSDYEDKIPMFLKSIYKIHKIKILNVQCVLLEIIDELPRIDAIRKHMNTIEKITKDQIIFYFRNISRYRRKSLIQNGIPFVIEDGQVFLPFITLYLKNTEERPKEEIETFTPSGQITYLYFLYNRETIVNATELSDFFGWTLMTSSRALNELYRANLLTYKVGGKTGRSKFYSRIPDPIYFKKGKEFLNSPSKKTVYVEIPPKNSLKAGLEALSELSMINPPENKVRAIYNEDINIENLEIIDNQDIIKDKKLLELQLWEYDPNIFAENGLVDKASLYLSLEIENDERIEQALEEALRDEIWYTG